LLYQVVHYNLKPNIDKIQKKEFYFILFSFERERERESQIKALKNVANIGLEY
jgi:hypothetical protein